MPRVPLHLYAVFHLNLAYSSIEEEQRSQVVKDCYWPLIRMARALRLPLGIEASGYTLEVIAGMDQSWIDELRELVIHGPCEFIGSGYSQLIGPLVPAKVNVMNFRLGYQVYERLLGIKPRLAFVSEQAFSAGLVPLYLDAGYRGIMMEWDNAAQGHPEWDLEWQYTPQVACGPNGEEIPVLWNRTVAFQKFQRYVHGESDLSDFTDYLDQQISSVHRNFPLYGNDVEIFGFRPGRYDTEAPLHPQGEWNRLHQLFEILKTDDRWKIIAPSEGLQFKQSPSAGNRLHLESVGAPIPVKKQAKYHVLRWALTGRSDSSINSACWRIHEALSHSLSTKDEDWRALCYLWSSDFRTHITDARWQAYLAKLQQAEDQWGTFGHPASVVESCRKRLGYSSNYRTEQEGRNLIVDSDCLKLALNIQKGLAIDGLWVKPVSPHSLLGTLPHGFYQNITMGADFFSGHLIFETPTESKITDLVSVQPEVSVIDDGSAILIEAFLDTKLGPISKCIVVNESGEVTIRYKLSWKETPPGVLRLGHFTLNPRAFHLPTLNLETHNGGFVAETFSLYGQSVDHGRPVSFLVSSNNGFGFTDGVLRLQDKSSQLTMRSDQGAGYLLPLLSVFPAAPSYFCRVSFSAMEFDDTSRASKFRSFMSTYELGLSASRVTPIQHGSETSLMEQEPAPC